MSAIRNSCVARGQAAANVNTVVYTVPAGFAFILKSVILTNESSTAVTPAIWSIAAGGSPYVFETLQPLAANASFSYATWHVLNSGDELAIGSSGSTVNYWVSGAVLPFTP